MEKVRLYNGDCMEILDGMEPASVDCVVCDLPYYKVVRDDFDNKWGSPEEYLGWVRSLLARYDRVLKDGSNIFLFTSRQYSRRICTLMDEMFDEKRVIIWCRKRGFNTTRGRALTSGYEPIAYYSKGSGAAFNMMKLKSKSKRREYTEGALRDGVSLSDVWTDIPALPHNAAEKAGHPTQKPVALMERIVLIGTNPGDTVLDSCMGSGSTGVACVKNGRGFVGIECDEGYFKIARKRINEANVRKLF